MELEECRAGGYKARFDPDRFDEVAETIREREEVDADTEHMMVWHSRGVKCSFVRSSGVMIMRTEDGDEAREIIEQFL